MNQMTSEEVAWFVGIFDGEGCISIKEANGGRRNFVVLKVKMCDFDVIRNLQNVSGIKGHSNITPAIGNHRASLAWHISKQEDVVDLLLVMKDFPFLSSRRKLRMEEALIVALGNSQKILARKQIQQDRLLQRQQRGLSSPSCSKHVDASFSIKNNLSVECLSCNREWRNARKAKVS